MHVAFFRHNLYPFVSTNNVVQAHYEAMRTQGESHSMAEILATRAFPGIKTDAIFTEGKFSGEAGRLGVEETWLREQAEAAGVSTTGKYYSRGLADYPGDPTAWVGDRGDVLRVAKEKNMTVHGYVEYQGHEVEPMPDVKIAPDIVDAAVADSMARDPGQRIEDVRERATQFLTGSIDNNPLLVAD